MKLFLCIAVFFLVKFQFVFPESNWLKTSKLQLRILRGEYIDRKADLLFLIDTSGSLTPDNYKDEKKFVTDLLNEISVSTEATRVELIPFGDKASIYIDQVSNPGLKKNKCTFNEEFDRMDQSINGWMTDMTGAFQLAYDVCYGKFSGEKRHSSAGKAVKTTILLLTDGKWNSWAPTPVSLAKNLTGAGVEVFAIGLGNDIDFPQLESLTKNPAEHAFHLQTFSEFVNLATYLRGGKLL